MITMADRLRARCQQLGLTAGQVAETAGVNRSFVYDIQRGTSKNPNTDKLKLVARVLKVQHNWLLHGLGEVEGETPVVPDPADGFAPIPYVAVRPSMGGGMVVDEEPAHGEPFHFHRGWIAQELRSEPRALRIMHVEGDSMEPTLMNGDIVLIDTERRMPTPPGVFVLHDGMGLVAKRLEHIPNSDPPLIRIISDNPAYSAYERTSDEVNIVGRIRWFGRSI